jgi:hypothetical protein
MCTPPLHPEAFALSASFCSSMRISSKRLVTSRMIAPLAGQLAGPISQRHDCELDEGDSR